MLGSGASRGFAKKISRSLLGAMIGALIAALAYTPDSGGGTLIDSNRGSLRAG